MIDCGNDSEYHPNHCHMDKDEPQTDPEPQVGGFLPTLGVNMHHTSSLFLLHKLSILRRWGIWHPNVCTQPNLSCSREIIHLIHVDSHIYSKFYEILVDKHVTSTGTSHSCNSRRWVDSYSLVAHTGIVKQGSLPALYLRWLPVWESGHTM